MQPAIIYCSNCDEVNRADATFCFKCGHLIHSDVFSGTTIAGRMPPQQMLKQRYKIVTLVGKGGMGAVYKAVDTQFGDRLVAVKEMSHSNLSLQEAVRAADQFKQEAHLLANLKHPNLPSIYDYFGENGRWYLVMDFIEGTTLDGRLNKVPECCLSINETLDIGIQLAKVLGYLHTRAVPVIFRDLKPLNIMVTPEDNIYLIDFGIARLFKTGKDKDTVAYVSPGYAAPEQFGRTQTSPQSDIYSLGATLHQLLSGSEPRSNMLLFTFKPLSSYNPNIPQSLANLVAKMVNTDPNQRPASMAEIRKELEHIQMQVRQESSSQAHPTQYASSPIPQPKLIVSTYGNKPLSPQAKLVVPAYDYPSPQPVAQQKQQQAYHVPAKQMSAKPALPKGKVWKTLLVGVVVGLLSIFLLVNHPLSLSGLAVVVIVVLLLLVAGLIIGIAVVLRRAGFFMGCTVAITFSVANFISYPISLYEVLREDLMYILIAGLIGLLGAWLATIKHPYYKKPRL